MEQGPGRRIEEERWSDGDVRKDKAKHGYRVRGCQHSGETLNFGSTQINPLTLSLTTSTSQPKTD